jgi:membrane-associated phospholipid phosphatase
MNIIINRIKEILFWQPKKDWFKSTSDLRNGRKFLIIINYVIWIFLFYVSYLLIRQNANIFWQLLVATVVSEIIEKIFKTKSLWKRPLYKNNNILPTGFLKSWYQKGSFPSGHAMKAAFFMLFVIQYQVMIGPVGFLLVVVPLISARIILGLHYPVDILGGIIMGIILWFLVKDITFPDIMVNSFKTIFDLVFLIN